MERIKTGDRFTRLTVMSRLGTDKLRRAVWECRCECGATTQAATGELVSGHKRSCGCLKVAMLKAATTKHGRSRTPVYNVWLNLKNRCANPASHSYRYYGGRGISVCARWRGSYPAFEGDMGPRPPGLTIDRIDNDGGYWCGKPDCPECGPLHRRPNCRWADRKTQTANRRPQIKR